MFSVKSSMYLEECIERDLNCSVCKSDVCKCAVSKDARTFYSVGCVETNLQCASGQ